MATTVAASREADQEVAASTATELGVDAGEVAAEAEVEADPDAEGEEEEEEEGTTHKYGHAEYWDDRYAGDDDPFDWLLEWKDFVAAGAHKHLPKGGKLLMAGCGNARFSAAMYDSGIVTDIHNVDLSSVVIEQMRTENVERTDMKYYVQNVRALDFADETFDCTVDKSTMDCLYCCDDSREACRDMVRECYRVLKPGGVHISLSLHAPEKGLGYLAPRGSLKWEVNHFLVPNPRYDGPDSGRSEHHTVFVCRKPLNADPRGGSGGGHSVASAGSGSGVGPS